MAELKCVESGCSNEAHYIHGGYSYCQTHHRREEQDSLKARWIYSVGLVLWVVFWILAFSGVTLGGCMRLNCILPLSNPEIS
jgi:hypothetical protein